MSGIETVLLIGGAVASAAGAVTSGIAQSNAAKYNAKLADQNAQVARDQAAAEARLQREKSEKILGATRAAYGASGVTLEGSPLDLLEESAANAELDNLNIRYKGTLQSRGYMNEASLYRAQARNARTSGIIEGISSIGRGIGNSYDKLG